MGICNGTTFQSKTSGKRRLSSIFSGSGKLIPCTREVSDPMSKVEEREETGFQEDRMLNTIENSFLQIMESRNLQNFTIFLSPTVSNIKVIRSFLLPVSLIQSHT